MAIKLTVKEDGSERSWDVIDGQQIDIRMSKGAEYALVDTRTGQTPDGMRIVDNHGQTEIYGSDSFPWVTLHDEQEAIPARIEQNFEPAPPAAAPEGSIALAEVSAVDAAQTPADATEHVQADEVIAPPNANSEGTPSGTSMLIAGGGALLVGGLSAALGGGSGGAYQHDEDTSFAPRPTPAPEPAAADTHDTAHAVSEDAAQAASTPYTLSMNSENLDFDHLLQRGALDASNHQPDTFNLSAGDLLAKPTTLTLDGDYGDHLDLSGGGWTKDSGSHYDHYETYHHGNFTLRVEEDISVSII